MRMQGAGFAFEVSAEQKRPQRPCLPRRSCHSSQDRKSEEPMVFSGADEGFYGGPDKATHPIGFNTP